MTRYIDADAFKLPTDLPYKGSVKRVLLQAPTADVVEVVRCVNRVYHTVFANRDMCTKHTVFWGSREMGLRETKPDHFCSYGERRTEDG